MTQSSALSARLHPSGGPTPVPDAPHDPAHHPPHHPPHLRAVLPAPVPAPAPVPDDTETSATDPAAVARDLALCAIEIIAGARDLETIARWITDDVHRHLQRRVVIATRGRSTRRTPPTRPVLRVGGVHCATPINRVAECTIIVHGKPRTRAVAIRLERVGQRWRATAINVL